MVKVNTGTDDRGDAREHSRGENAKKARTIAPRSAKARVSQAVHSNAIAGRTKVPAPSRSADVSKGSALITRALNELRKAGKLKGARSDKISARVDPGVLKAAAERLGLRESDVSDVINAALAVAAAPDNFKLWLRNTPDTLPDDFELAV